MEVYFNVNALNIIISPHLDDAVISMGGFILKNFKNTKIITIFSGKPEKKKYTIWDYACGFRNSDQAVNSRIKENDKALSSLGVLLENIINLDFLDIQYTLEKDRVYDIKKIKDYLYSYIINSGYDNINIFSPIANKHKDHKSIKNIILILKNENKKQNLKFFFYEDYPYFLNYKKSKNFVLKESKNKVSIYLSDLELSKKTLSIKEYKSQFRNPFSGLSIFKNRIKKNKNGFFNIENYYLLS